MERNTNFLVKVVTCVSVVEIESVGELLLSKELHDGQDH